MTAPKEWHEVEKLTRRVFEAADWRALGEVYFHEDGEQHWADRRKLVVELGVQLARRLALQVPRGGASLWVGAGVAELPVLLAAGWRLSVGAPVRWEQGLGFLLAAVLLLLWENLSNDLFDADTGVDAVGKPHSVVALLGRKQPVRQWSWLALLSALGAGTGLPRTELKD